MSEMARISCRQGRVPSASMMFSIMRSAEETADMTALEYHESLIREIRTLHKPRDANGVVVEIDKDIDSNDENLMEFLA